MKGIADLNSNNTLLLLEIKLWFEAFMHYIKPEVGDKWTRPIIRHIMKIHSNISNISVSWSDHKLECWGFVEPLYMQAPNPLGPTNYTGSNIETSKCKAVSRVQTLTTKRTKPSGVAIVKELKLARPKGEAER